MPKAERSARVIIVRGKQYALKDHIPPAAFYKWADCNWMDETPIQEAVNALLMEPVAMADFGDVEEWFEFLRALSDFFVTLRWGRAVRSPSSPTSEDTLEDTSR